MLEDMFSCSDIVMFYLNNKFKKNRQISAPNACLTTCTLDLTNNVTQLFIKCHFKPTLNDGSICVWRRTKILTSKAPNNIGRISYNKKKIKVDNHKNPLTHSSAQTIKSKTRQGYSYRLQTKQQMKGHYKRVSCNMQSVIGP